MTKRLSTRNILVLLLAPLVTSASLAQNATAAPVKTGPYVGIGLGGTGFAARNSPLKDVDAKFGDAGNATKLVAGFQLAEWFGVEVGGIQSSTVKRSFVVNGQNVEQKGKINAFYLAATGKVAVTESFAFNGRLGVARGEFKGTNVLPTNASLIGTKTGLMVGVGMEYRFTPTLIGTLDLENFNSVSDRVRSPTGTLGLKVMF
jgi:hypothetical protein